MLRTNLMLTQKFHWKYKQQQQKQKLCQQIQSINKKSDQSF